MPVLSLEDAELHRVERDGVSDADVFDDDADQEGGRDACVWWVRDLA